MCNKWYRNIIQGIFGLLLGSLCSSLWASEHFSHALWDTLLQQYVHPVNGGVASQVDYAGLQKQRGQLKKYLQQLAGVSRTDFDNWEKHYQLAFLINAYNAWTVELILSRYPDLESIKDLGSFFKSPWKQEFINLLGEKRSLDNIEHTLIRGSGRYNEARVHFAVNCASIGCPALRAEAWSGEKLDTQLEESTRLFLQDRSRNRWNKEGLELSRIFKWYREDFEKYGNKSLYAFLTHYVSSLRIPEAQQQSLRQGKMDISWLDYDWRLNKTP